MKKNIRNNLLILILDVMIVVLSCFSYYSISEKAILPERVQYQENISSVNDTNTLYHSDIIKFIDGIEVESELNLEIYLDRYNSGEIVSLQIERFHHNIEIKIKLDSYYDKIYLITLLFCGFSFLFSAFFVLLRSDDLILARVFHGCLFSIFAMLFFTWGSLNIYPDWVNILFRTINGFSYLLVPATSLHFSFLFPFKKINRINKIFKYVYYILILAIVPLFINDYIYIVENDINYFNDYLFWVSDVLKTFLTPIFIFIIFNFLHSYISTKDDIAKGRLLWVFLGLLPGPALYVFLYQMTRIIFGKTLISETTMVAFLILTPLTLMIAIVRYRFMDIRLFYRRSAVYGIVLSLLAACYVLIIYFLSLLLQDNVDNYFGISNAVAALVNVLLYNPVKNSIQKLIDRKFFKENYDHRKVEREFLRDIKNCLSKNEIFNLVNETIQKTIPIESFSFFIYIEEQDDLNYVSDNDNQIDPNNLYLLKETCKENREKVILGKEFAVEEGVQIFVNNDLLERIDAELVLASYTEDLQLINIFTFGKKKSGFIYSQNDIDILRLLVIESGNTLHRINLLRKLLIQREETKKLEEISEMKSYFVSSVSHEFKTPLTSIKLFAELLSVKNNLDENKRQEFLEIIKGECERLNRLVNNVLDFSKIERGTKEYIFDIIDLNEIVDSVIRTLNYRLKIQKFDFESDLLNENLFILGDRDALAEVIINLISNSIKYSNNNKFIRIKTYKKDSYIYFEISDKGIGMSESDLENIFKAYYRSNDEMAKNIKGTGIGLSLVNSIMTAHKGSVQVKSEPGKGSTFSLIFPMEKNK